MDKREQFYKNLKKKLKKDTSFPAKYLFKFIVPAAEDKIKQIEDLFDFTGAVITKTLATPTTGTSSGRRRRSRQRVLRGSNSGPG